MNFLHPRIYLSFAALSLLLIIPFSAGSNFVFHLFILICSYAALASAWNIVGGFAGQLSLGHAVFYGTGAYVSTLLLLHLGMSPWLGMLVGAVVSTVLAVVISWPCFRLRGPFFALATIAVLEVVRLLVINQHDLTGGAAGLAVPLKLGAEWMLFRARWPYLLIAFGFLAITLLVSWKIKHSRLGYYLIAVREREDAAQGEQGSAVEQRFHFAKAFQVLLQMTQVLFLAGGVDHQEQLVIRQPRDHQVVEDAPVGAGEQRVTLHTHRQVDDIHRHQALQRLAGIHAAQADLAHMGDVEQAGLLAGVQVFLEYAQRILDRHRVAGKRHHARTQFQVQSVQRCLL